MTAPTIDRPLAPVPQQLGAIADEVDGAFRELECASRQNSPHGGDVVAYLECHDCYRGWCCADHYKIWVEHIAPENRATLARLGYIRCPHCKQKFTNLDVFQKAYPI